MTDVTEASGITFRHTDGSSGERYVIESMTAGVALFDFDQDGDLDIYFLNGAPLKGTDVERAPTNALYRNDGNWRFTDVTAEAGVGDVGYGLGVCVGDYDNDGDPDLYVNNFGANVLYENQGDGRFIDVTEVAGVANGNRVGAGASFFDMDADGDLDLYVANYIQFSYAEHRPHRRRGLPAYPSPMSYRPDPDTLYRNNGDGTFSDVSVASGVAAHAGTGMGVVCSDYDMDGDLDVFVANDQRANFLFENDGSGKFEEVGLLRGVALDYRGHAQATMGIDAGDFNNDGLIDIHTTSFSGEWATLYRNNQNGVLIEDVTRATDAGEGTLPHVTWGNGFADFDNDGHRDLFIACGHLDDNLDQLGGNDTTAYRVANVLLKNTGRETFIDVSRHSGDGMQVALSSRGVALGDLDNDGDEDVVILNSRREPTLLRNDSTASHHWIAIRLIGADSNRSGVGARVTVVADDLVQVREVHSGRGYQSHFGTPLHFGLGSRERIDRIEVEWIGGGRDVLQSLPVDQTWTITEGGSVSSARVTP
ncbi:CRTAC1 family protein [Roseimaritima sediminicola]|uniref:CRTAC1 family protein n=1 Tax=Roseimaritima sediminicola TaxID=2662066 RepID=UPI00138669C4|nr:CRTAC1 family protein [Roseimaritima sediminicola]